MFKTTETRLEVGTGYEVKATSAAKDAPANKEIPELHKTLSQDLSDVHKGALELSTRLGGIMRQGNDCCAGVIADPVNTAMGAELYDRITQVREIGGILRDILTRLEL